MSSIHKVSYKKLDFFILSRDAIDKIIKIIIFIDKIDDTIEIVKYLRSQFFERIKNKKYLKDIIYIFLTNFTIILRSRVLANLQLSNIQIWIYIEYTDMSINFFDIRHIIQF